MEARFGSMYAGQVAPIEWHVNWPNSADPAYLYNPTEVEDRRTWYVPVTYVPQFRFDGKDIIQYNGVDTTAWFADFERVVDSLLLLSSPIAVDLIHTRDADSVYITVVVTVENVPSGSLNLFVTASEEWYRDSPFGKQWYVFRDMLTGATGDPISLTTPGEIVSMQYSYPIDTLYHPARLITTAWVQKSSTKKVLNSASELVPLYTVGVPGSEVPVRIVLDQNTPNPFNPTTSIGFSLDRESRVRLSVYSQAGRLVTNLVDGRVTPGSHSATWNGTDLTGKAVGSGVYYYRLDTDKNSLTGKMILVR